MKPCTASLFWSHRSHRHRLPATCIRAFAFAHLQTASPIACPQVCPFAIVRLEKVACTSTFGLTLYTVEQLHVVDNTVSDVMGTPAALDGNGNLVGAAAARARRRQPRFDDTTTTTDDTTTTMPSPTTMGIVIRHAYAQAHAVGGAEAVATVAEADRRFGWTVRAADGGTALTREVARHRAERAARRLSEREAHAYSLIRLYAGVDAEESARAVRRRRPHTP